MHCLKLHYISVASFTKVVNQRLAKRPLKTNGHLANRGLTSLVKEASGVKNGAALHFLLKVSNLLWRCRQLQYWTHNHLVSNNSLSMYFLVAHGAGLHMLHTRVVFIKVQLQQILIHFKGNISLFPNELRSCFAKVTRWHRHINDTAKQQHCIQS